MFKHETVWLILVALDVLMTVFQMVTLHWFNHLKELMIIKKRFPKYIKAEVMLTIACLLVAFPLQSKKVYAPDYIIHIPEYITTLIVTPLYHSVMIMECGRHWLIAYELRYLHHSQNDQWKTVIDATHDANNWVVQTHGKYETDRVVKKVMAAYIFFAASSVCIGSMSGWEMYWLIIVFHALVYATLIIGVYCQCHKYHELADEFYFYFELRATAIIWIICCVASGVPATSDNAVGNLISVLSPAAIVLAPSILSTVVIPYKIRSNAMWHIERTLNKKKRTKATKFEMQMRHQDMVPALQDGTKKSSSNRLNNASLNLCG